MMATGCCGLSALVGKPWWSPWKGDGRPSPAVYARGRWCTTRCVACLRLRLLCRQLICVLAWGSAAQQKSAIGFIPATYRSGPATMPPVPALQGGEQTAVARVVNQCIYTYLPVQRNHARVPYLVCSGRRRPVTGPL